MRRFSPRLLLALPVLVVLIVVLSGCESFTVTGTTAQQQDVVGPVRIASAIEGCDNNDPNPSDVSDCTSESGFQLLSGYRVPAGTAAPESFDSSGIVTSTFHKSSSYTSELERLAPAPAGEEWVGYLSDTLNVPSLDAGPQKISAGPDMGLPSGFTGAAFNFAVVTGLRTLSPVSATDPVACNASSLFATSSDSSTQCAFNPNTLDAVNTDSSTDVSNLLLSAGTAPSVHPGDTATVPFVAKLTGVASGASFALGGSSPLAGATVTPASPTLSAAPGDNATTAAVKVPANAAPGDYPVTLTATHGTATRQATGSVHVLALPSLIITLGKTSLTVSKGGTVSLPVSCPSTSLDPCNGTVSLVTAGKVLVAKKHKARKRTLKLGSGKFSVPAGKTGTVKIKLSAAGRKALARTGKLRANATFTLTNRAGVSNKTVKHLTLKRAKARKKHKH